MFLKGLVSGTCYIVLLLCKGWHQKLYLLTWTLLTRVAVNTNAKGFSPCTIPETPK